MRQLIVEPCGAILGTIDNKRSMVYFDLIHVYYAMETKLKIKIIVNTNCKYKRMREKEENTKKMLPTCTATSFAMIS
jgi:hypothetical protein